MKKIILLISVLALALISAFLIYQFRPSKVFTKNLIQARIMLQKGNLERARSFYQKAYKAKEGYTPHVSLEVLEVENAIKLNQNNLDAAITNTQAFLKDFPKSLLGKNLLSRYLIQKGDFPAALKLIQEVIKEDPKNFPARHLLAQFREKTGRQDLAEEQLRILYDLFPDSVESLLPLASNLLKQGKFKECRVFLAKVLEKTPSNNSAQLLLLDTYLRQNMFDSAYKVLDKWAETETSVTQQVHIRKARLLAALGKVPEAKQLLSKYEKFEIKNINALSEIALLQVQSDQIDSAIKIYERLGDMALEVQSKSKLLVHYLSLRNRDYAKALKLIQELRIGKEKAQFATNVILNYWAMGLSHKIEEFTHTLSDSVQFALKTFQASLVPGEEFIQKWAMLNFYRLNSQFRQLYLLSKEMYQKWPQNEFVLNLYTSQLIAARAFNESLSILKKIKKPTLAQQIKIVQILFLLNNSSKAISIAKKLQKQNPGLKGINMLLADYYRGKDKSKYIYHLDQELNLDSRSVAPLNNLAWEYGIEQKNYQKAIPYIERLEENEAGDPRIMDTLGWFFALNKKYGKAEKYLKNALILIPDNPDMLYHMGWLQHKLGKFKESSEYLNKSLIAGLSGESSRTAKKLLASMN